MGKYGQYISVGIGLLQLGVVLVFLRFHTYIYVVSDCLGKSLESIPLALEGARNLRILISLSRDLRRERRSMMRRMSMLARDSILITPNVQTPDMMRRFSRRMSRLSRPDLGSPALLRRMGDEPQLRRRTNRGGSLADVDVDSRDNKWTRSSSLWNIYEDKVVTAYVFDCSNRILFL